MELTGEAVDKIMKGCLFRDGEPQDHHVEVRGIRATFRYHPVRLFMHTPDIVALLEELPKEFQAGGGGGWSFLNACQDKHGRQWTDLHQTMEALLALGIAAGKARWCLRRDMWDALPGGMPYVVVDTQEPLI